MVKRVSKLLAACVLFGTATSVTAQSFNQELTRYRAARFECQEAFQQRIERTRSACVDQCLTRAEGVRDRCLATAERRYGEALQRALRIRN